MIEIINKQEAIKAVAEWIKEECVDCENINMEIAKQIIDKVPYVTTDEILNSVIDRLEHEALCEKENDE